MVLFNSRGAVVSERNGSFTLNFSGGIVYENR